MSKKEGGIDHLYSLVTEKTKSTVQRALAWAREYEINEECEYSSHQTAVIVFIYESIKPDLSWEIGEALCKMVPLDINFIVIWIRENFRFEKEAVYEAFKTWMKRETSLGNDYAYSMNKTYEIMQEAAYNSDKGLLEWLLSGGIEVDFRDASRNTALHIAANEGHLETVNFLLNRGASPLVFNSELQRPFDLAVDNEHFDVCDCLCQAGIMIVISESYFLNVVLEGNFLKLRYLLKKTSYNFIWNGLLIAVEKGYPHILETLLRYCHTQLATIEFNKNVLTTAFIKGDRNIIEKLLAAGFQMDESLIAELRKQNMDDLLNFFLPKRNVDTVD